MISTITLEKLKDPHINPDADRLTDALRYMLYRGMHFEQHSYACECKHCDITLYTSIKRLNCEYCGSSDPEVSTCTELE